MLPVGRNWHEIYLWLLLNEIRPYLGRTFTSITCGIVEFQNPSFGGISPNLPSHCGKFGSILYFSQFSLIVLIKLCPTPIRIRHEVIALASEGMRQSVIAGRVGLTRATVNHILRRHAATGTLVPGKSTGVPRKTTPRQDHALLRMVRQDCFISARALRNLYGMRSIWKTNNNRFLSRGYRAYRPTRKPLLTATPPSPLGVGAEVAEPDNGPLAPCYLRWRVKIPTLPGRWQA